MLFVKTINSLTVDSNNPLGSFREATKAPFVGIVPPLIGVPPQYNKHYPREEARLVVFHSTSHSP